MTILSLINIVKEQLQGIYPPNEIRAVTHVVFKHFCKLNAAELYINLNKIIEEETVSQIIDAVSQLKKHRPLQYILGETDFYGLRFYVDENVLIPRPETEELVQWIINDCKNNSISFLDIGTGSGAIAVTLAKNLAMAQVWALDVSDMALNVADKNAQLNNVAIHFFRQDILDHNLQLPQKFDCIVSNPPYVRNSEMELMHTNVLNYEPHTALFVDDNNPLLFYKAIAKTAKQWLKPNGCVYVEINEGLGADTETLFQQYGFSTVLKNDINNKARMIKAKLSL